MSADADLTQNQQALAGLADACDGQVRYFPRDVVTGESAYVLLTAPGLEIRMKGPTPEESATRLLEVFFNMFGSN